MCVLLSLFSLSKSIGEWLRSVVCGSQRVCKYVYSLTNFFFRSSSPHNEVITRVAQLVGRLFIHN